MKEESKNIGLNREGHLDENSIAVCAEWLAGKSDELEPLLKNHLERCARCKNDVLEISEFVKDGSNTGSSDSGIRDKFEETCAAKYSPSIRQVNSTQFWKVAAIFLILITVTSLVIFIRPDKRDLLVSNKEPADSSVVDSVNRNKEVSGDKSDTLKKGEEKAINLESISDDLVASNFNPNPAIEALIGVQFRDGGRPVISSPPEDTTLIVGSKLNFSCNNPNYEKLEIQILDNKGKVIARYADLKNVSLNIEMEYPQGLFYWKLNGEEEMYQAGKILLKKHKNE